MHQQTSGSSTRPPRTLVATLTVIDPVAAGVRLRREADFAQGDRASVTLEHADAMRVVLTALRHGATLGAERTDDWLALDVVEGSVQLERDGERADLAAGMRAIVQPESPWSLTATSDEALLMSTFTPERSGEAT